MSPPRTNKFESDHVDVSLKKKRRKGSKKQEVSKLQEHPVTLPGIAKDGSNPVKNERKERKTRIKKLLFALNYACVCLFLQKVSQSRSQSLRSP